MLGAFMIIFDGIWYGKTVGVNKWHGARALRNKNNKWIAQIFETKEAKEFKNSLVSSWVTKKTYLNFDGFVDMAVSLNLWKMKDSDSCIKFLMDSLEDAGILENDRKIRNIFIYRHYHKKSELDIIKVRLTSVDN